MGDIIPEPTPEDLKAVLPLVEKLDCQWWRRDYHHHQLAAAYALGRAGGQPLSIA